MILSRALYRTALLCALLPVTASAQALTSLTSVYVTYITRKATANPTGELKARLDSVDRDLLVASRFGRTGEVRRLFAKGLTLLAGKPWSDAADFNASLLLRSDRTVIDSRQPYAVRIEQLYAPTIDLPSALLAHATLVSRAAGAGEAPQVVKDFGMRKGVSRDLRESPFLLDLDLRDVANGRYVVVVDLSDSARSLGTATLPVVLRNGIDDLVRRLDSAAAQAPTALRAEILYPGERMRQVNRGQLELRTLDVDKDFANADAVVTAVHAGRDPFAGRTGDIKRH